MSRKFLMFIGSGIAVAIGSIATTILLYKESDQTKLETFAARSPGRSDIHPSAGQLRDVIHARQWDPATKGGTPRKLERAFTLRPEKEVEYEEAALHEVDPRELFGATEKIKTWLPTLEWLNPYWGDPDRKAAEMRCRAQADLTEACDGSFTVVVERVGPETGRVAYARWDDEIEREPECQELMECAIKTAWIGRSGPFPKGKHRYFSIPRGTVWQVGLDRAQYLDGLRQGLPAIRDSLAQMRNRLQQAPTPSLEYYRLKYQIGEQEKLLQYAEWRLKNER